MSAPTRELRGCGTALVTPFAKDLSLDEGALRAFVDWQIEQGIHFLVPCGSTGEGATLTREEHLRVVRVVAEQAAGRVPVIGGLSGNDTRATVELAKAVADQGPSHLMVTGPPYNRPPQRGFVAHFERIADAVSVPVVLYNVPGRTGSNIQAKTTLELARHENIVAIKEASGNLDQILTVLLERPPGFSVLSGDDNLTVPVMALGGDGVVSVVSNAVPGPMSRLAQAMLDGDLACARELTRSLNPIMHAGFVESNPIPIKAAIAELGRMENALRLPLVPLAAEHRETLREALRAAGAL
ncbi:MAG TPA: 4-hydroxy-tetrahydrodipicolinate synthase [Longimicrobiales bacterium]|nr:4-hydroxy-tetrahydrodipicolinate synthase [Longimicrobiales bacterium]